MGEQETLRCPHCGGRDALSLTEVHEEIGVTDPGRIEIDGISLVPPGDFYWEPGGTVRVLVVCESCRHEWRPRRQSVSTRPGSTR